MKSFSFVDLLNNLPIEIILWFILGATVIVFGIYSAILFWHWKLYSTGKFTTVSSMIVYLSVGAGLILVMILSIFGYSFI
jgi:hypothetical protein